MLSPWDSFKKMYEYTTQEVVVRMNMGIITRILTRIVLNRLPGWQKLAC